MRNWRVLCSLLLACTISLGACGGASAAEWTPVEEMGIDPWGELDSVQSTPSSSDSSIIIDNNFNDNLSDDAIMPLSLTDSTAWNFTINYMRKVMNGYELTAGGLTMNWGALNGGSAANSGTTTNSVSGFDNFFPLRSATASSSSAYGTGYMQLTGWQYIWFEQPVDFKASDYPTISYSGTVTAYMSLLGQSTASANLSELKSWKCFTSARLVVNGVRVGDSITPNNGVFTFSGELDLESIGDITSIGFCFIHGDSVSSTEQFSFSNVYAPAYCGVTLLDNLILDLPEPEDPALGLLGTIISWLQSILNAIINLPANIANLVVEGLKGLFLPSAEDLTAIKEQYATLLEERLGFVWQAGTLVTDFFGSVLSSIQSGGEYTFQFPGITVPLNGQSYTIVAAQTVSLDNDAMTVIRSALGTIVSIVSVVAFVGMAEDMVTAFVSGESYFGFITKRRGEE